MILHLVRHGDANPRQGSWSTDDDRPLSTRGREQARRVGAALHRLGARPDLVLTSPLARAAETAEHISAALLIGSDPIVTAVLRPGASAGALLEELGHRHPDANEVVCTGHMPDLGYMASQLAAGPESAPCPAPWN